MLNFINQIVVKKVKHKVFHQYPKIEVTPGNCRFNFRCSYNAVHDAIENGDEKIAMCFYKSGDDMIIHFLNYRDGKYIDNTLGHWASQYEYYLIRMIDKEDFFKINNIFGDYRKQIQKELPFVLRILNTQEF